MGPIKLHPYLLVTEVVLLMNVVKLRRIEKESIDSSSATNLGDGSAQDQSDNGSGNAPQSGNAHPPALQRVKARFSDPIEEGEVVEFEKQPDSPEPTSKPATTGYVPEDLKPWLNLVKLAALTLKGCLIAAWVTFRAVMRYFLRHPIHAALNVCLVIVLGLVIFTGSEIHNQMILNKISDQTIDNIIEGSRFTRAYDSEVVNRNGPQELLRVGGPHWVQREGVRAILFHARKAGFAIEDQAVLLAIADIESGFNPMARAPTTTACGLFQFVKRTGEIFGLPQSECMDPMANARAQVAHYQYNFERRVKPHVEHLTGSERVFRTFELSYYLHHDGPESRNPSNDLKATVLSGTQVLFKSYHSLLAESESQTRAPTFAEQFYANLLKFLDTTRMYAAKLGLGNSAATNASASSHTPELVASDNEAQQVPLVN